MKPPYSDEILQLEVEIDMLRWQCARERAEELVRDRGWSEKDEDFSIQVEDETKRQWDEDNEREMSKRCLWDEEIIENSDSPLANDTAPAA